MTPLMVTPERLPEWLPFLEWHFRAFCRGDKWTPEELVADVLNGSRTLWIAFDGGVEGAALAHIADGSHRACVVTHAAGRKHRRWAHLMSALEDWAREHGCQSISAVTRPGWERALPEMKKTHVVLEKRL